MQIVLLKTYDVEAGFILNSFSNFTSYCLNIFYADVIVNALNEKLNVLTSFPHIATFVHF